MPDPLQELLAAGAVPTTSFPPTSRYSDVDVDAWDPGHGLPPVPFLKRRFCPRPERFARDAAAFGAVDFPDHQLGGSHTRLASRSSIDSSLRPSSSFGHQSLASLPR